MITEAVLIYMSTVHSWDYLLMRRGVLGIHEILAIKYMSSYIIFVDFL